MYKKYYTPSSIAQLMAKFLDMDNPTTAVDICAGSWNLLEEIKNKWKGIELIGVDIDNNSLKKVPTNSKFFQLDGREFALQCIGKNKRFSLVLANPPFGKDIKGLHFIFSKIPGYKEMTKRALDRIETTMILANLAIIEKKGYMVAIVPRTFINGEWSKHLRKYISANFSLKSILDLPSNVFGRDICTSIIVLQNVMPNEAATKLYNVDISEEKVCYEYINDLNHSLVKDGIWTTNIVLKQAINDFKVLRGNVDSSSLSTKGLYPIIHSTDINGLKNNNWKPTRFCSEPKSSAFHKLVKCGDIVLIRVGRNCGKATRIDFNKQLPVSDCLWIIRGNDMSLSNKIWNIINSKQFIEDISKLRKGVGAYYLTTEMFMQYINDKLKYASG